VIIEEKIALIRMKLHRNNMSVSELGRQSGLSREACSRMLSVSGISNWLDNLLMTLDHYERCNKIKRTEFNEDLKA